MPSPLSLNADGRRSTAIEQPRRLTAGLVVVRAIAVLVFTSAVVGMSVVVGFALDALLHVTLGDALLGDGL